MSRLVLDAGALIALDRNDAPMWRRLAVAKSDGREALTHGGIVGQVWSRPARQARLARALKAVDVQPLDHELGRAAGVLLAGTQLSDVLDAALALLCTPDDVVYTSDVDDLTTLLGERGLTTVGVVRV